MAHVEGSVGGGVAGRVRAALTAEQRRIIKFVGGPAVVIAGAGTGKTRVIVERVQLSIYALACRDALGLGRPERVTLYFTEAKMRLSTIRTDAQLDAARAAILERAARMRTGDFAATPSERACDWCDYAALCPSRWGSA